jgi:hypothetical protein
MGAVVCSLEVNHTVEACVRRAITLATMRIEFFLGEDVSTGLERGQN